MRKLLAIALGAMLLVIGTGVVLAQTSAPAARPAAPAASTAPNPAASAGTKVDRETVLSKVLKGLVADGTITQAQADKIAAGVQTEQDKLRAERKAEMEKRQAERKAAREAAKAAREQLRTFLADGVITADELAKLPADSPLRKLDKVLDDGKITIEELRGLGLGQWKHAFGLGRGHGQDKAPNASAAPSAATG